MTATDLPVEHLMKRRVTTATMLWDGTPERAEQIKAWVGTAAIPGGQVFRRADETTSGETALLFVAHNNSWSPLPVGYRVAREIDGSGFYPLSPEGAAASYEMGGAS